VIWQDIDGNEIISSPDKAIGFIYLITRIDTGRKYVGKKLLTFRRTKTVSGKKKKVNVESDWKDYYGSNEELKTEVKELGESLFKREILYFCFSKSECNYLETFEIFSRNALLSEDYYNHWVTCRITKKHVYSALKKNDFKNRL
jgi:hypothetical protein